MEEELNAYLVYWVRKWPKKLVRKASLRLGEDAVTTNVTIDTDEMVSTGSDLSDQIFKELFAGSQNLEVSGRFSSQDGWGNYEVQQVRLNGKMISPTLVILILSPGPQNCWIYPSTRPNLSLCPLASSELRWKREKCPYSTRMGLYPLCNSQRRAFRLANEPRN